MWCRSAQAVQTPSPTAYYCLCWSLRCCSPHQPGGVAGPAAGAAAEARWGGQGPGVQLLQVCRVEIKVDIKAFWAAAGCSGALLLLLCRHARESPERRDGDR